MAVELTGLVCVITGAGRGVGRGLAGGFSRRGARVVAGVLDAGEAESVPPGAWALPFDVRSAEQVEAAVDAIIARYGRIDAWVNNAGIYPRKPVDQLTFDDWRDVLDTNLDGAWRCCQALIPHFKRQRAGVVINVGSVALRIGMPDVANYLASKGGLVGLTRGLARELGKYRVRVNCVHLGAVLTETELRVFPDQEAMSRTLDERQSIPGRMTPESVEPVFAFLVSPESFDVTGQCLTVDRGWTHD